MPLSPATFVALHASVFRSGAGRAGLGLVLAMADPVAARALEDELPPRCASSDPDLAPSGRIGPVEYRDALRRGVGYRRDRRDAAARAVFRDTYVRAGTAQALAQLALAEHALGRSSVAAEHLREALACEDDDWIGRHRSVLARELERIDAAVAGPPPTTEPSALGPAEGPPEEAPPTGAPAPAPLPPAADARTTAIPDRPPPGESDPPPDRRRVASIGLLGAGAALVAASGITFAFQRRAQNDLESACPERTVCDRRDLHDRARRLAAATDVLLVSGLSGLVVGVLMRLLPGGRPSDGDDAGVAPDVSVACGPGVCGLQMNGSF